MFKAIISNTVAQLVAKFVAVSLTFITTVLIIRLGGPDLFGDLTKVLSLVAIGFTAIDFGLNAEAVRTMKGDIGSQQEILETTLFARALLSFVVIIVINIIVYFLPGGYTPAVKSVFWIGSVAIFFQGVYTSANAWFQRRLQYWKMSLATVIGTVIGTGLTYWAIKTSPTLPGLLAASTGGYIVMGLTAVYLLPRMRYRRAILFSRGLQLMRRSLPLGLILLASIIASKIDTVILGIFRSSADVGQYGFAYRIFDVILVLPVFAMNSIYPLLVEMEGTHKRNIIGKSSVALCVLGIIATIGVIIFAPLINYIRPGMDLTISILRVLAVSLPLFYLTAPLMWQLIEAGLEKYLFYVYMVAAVCNGLANLVLAPRFGPLASAVLTGVTEAIILSGLHLVKKRMYGNN